MGQVTGQVIGRDEVERLRGTGAVVVDVLPAEEYADEHLPGAINIPLRDLDATAAQALDRGQPVVVYCYDSQ